MTPRCSVRIGPTNQEMHEPPFTWAGPMTRCSVIHKPSSGIEFAKCLPAGMKSFGMPATGVAPACSDGGQQTKAAGCCGDEAYLRPWRAEPLVTLAEHYRLVGQWQLAWQACLLMFRHTGALPYGRPPR